MTDSAPTPGIPPLLRLRRGEALDGRVALLGMDSPPVNAFALPLRRELFEALAQAIADETVSAIVLHGIGKGFSAGGDIKEFGTPEALQSPGLSSELQVLIEASPKPVIAALHGFALGGGLEVALACHYRVAGADTLVGTPEVGIGLIPLSATQRLPRLVEFDLACDMVLQAQPRRAQQLADTLLFDCISPDGSDRAVLAAAIALASEPALPTRPTRERPVLRGATPNGLPAEDPSVHGHAHTAALTALRACAELPFDAGMAAARAAYEQAYAAREAARASGPC